MWRAFARSNSKVALVFRVPLKVGAAQPLRITLNPVDYYTADQLGDAIIALGDSIAANKDFLLLQDRSSVVGLSFMALLLQVVCLKHEGFKEEKEWRLFHM